jgi:hypothetical protein
MDKTQKNSAKMQRTGIMADQHKEEENRNPTSSWIPNERVSLLAILDLHQDLISETATRNDVRYLQTNRRLCLENAASLAFWCWQPKGIQLKILESYTSTRDHCS